MTSVVTLVLANRYDLADLQNGTLRKTEQRLRDGGANRLGLMICLEPLLPTILSEDGKHQEMACRSHMHDQMFLAKNPDDVNEISQ
jgi:hypothetical protein